MQRRAAAIYAAFFIVLGAASFSVIATATAPTVEFPNAEHRYAEGDSFSVAGTEYTAESLTATSSGGGGGHGGGGGGISHTATFAWVNESARYTETWEHNATVTFQGEEYRVHVPNESDPGAFTLREELNETAILQDDPAADNETITRDGERYVVVEEEGETTLVPADEYFPDPATTQIAEGETIDYDGNETTVANVSTDAVTLAWTGERRNTVEVGQESNVTLGGEQYLAFFPNNDTVVLTQNYESYRQQNRAIATHHERTNGLWGVTILSGLTATFLFGLAYMPSRY